MDGILVVNKPKGYTSHDVVAKLRRVYKMKKIGHTGTLDPEVEGVMVVCFGRATKLVPYLISNDKTYTCTMCIGTATDTEDLTGTVTHEQILSTEEAKQLEQTLEETIHSFVGTYQQVPPMYSAVKIDGKKLYEYARAEETVERVARAVTIQDIITEPSSFRFEDGKVYYTFTATVSKGTFIRTLCVDIGTKLGYPATMAALTRSASGAYTMEDARNLDDIIEHTPDAIAISDVQLDLPQVMVEHAVAEKLKNGYKLPKYFVEEELNTAFAVYDKETANLIGIFQPSQKYIDKYESIRII